MEALTKPRLTLAEYFALEAEGEIKHEYIDGEIYPMTGGTDKHSRIAANAIGAFFAQLSDSDCFVYASDMRIKASASRYLYPDLSIVCGEARHEDEGETSLLNPILVVEVTSPATINYDRGQKREFYQEMSSVQAYLIIDQRRIRAELHSRGKGDWLIQTFADLDDVIPLELIGCELPLAQVYRGISFSKA
jgi:Uma2 family endonuclease